MRIYVKSNSASFHPDPIRNEGAFSFLKTVAPTRKTRKEQKQDE